MLADPEKVLADYAEIGCKYVAVPYLTEECRPGTDGFTATVEGIRKIAEAAKKLGIQLLYHNHDFEFVKLDGEYALDVLYSTIPADLLQTEIDTCWVKVAGVDPSFSFMPVGHGEQDMPSILPACEDAGANWVVVEQDDPAKGATRLESVKLSREYLQTLSW